MAENDMSINMLVNLLKTEKKSGEVTTLGPDFYAKIAEKLKAYPTDSDEYRNTKKVADAIRERRTQKVLVYIAYGKELPRPVPTEEEDLYIQIKNILNKSGDGARPSKIKVAKHIPQIVTPAGNRIGPYEQNEVVNIYDRADAKFMVDNKLGDVVE